ncbi:MAG: hypothetical protein M1817_002384 [Caeruleum heppii]|nr:MAG: hypothetical protein M1817_002384 [Caeruleum heppii]
MPKGMSMVNAGLSKVSAQLPFAPNPKREHNLQDLGNLGRPRSKTETRLSPKPQIAYDPQVAGEGSTGTPLQIEHRPTHRRSQSDDVALSPSATRTQVAAQDGQSDPPSRGKGADPRPDETRPSPIYSRPLRRTNSDISLVLRRSMSTASSLGDDTRFEDVREAVNSRFKALRDSMVDSRIRLPNMASIHDVSLPSFRLPELNVLRGATSSNGQSKATVPQDRPGLSTNASDGSKHSSTTILSLTDREGRTRPTPLSRGDDASYLTNALRNLTGDVVIMGGYRGSILRSAKPPHRQLWIPVKVGLNLRRADLEVGLAPEDEENMESRIIASGMLTHVGPVDIARRLIKRLKTCENAKSGILRVWDYGYDWRLSPHLLSRRFMAFMQSLPSNKDKVRPQGATVIAHSLGGLITRHAVNQRPELFAGVVYAGVPQACVNILGPLRNGDEVLLSSRVLTAQVNFTIRTSYALLPEDGRCFIDKRTKETYPVDFFDVNTWVEHCLSPCVAPPLPALIRQREGLGKRGSSSALIKLPLPGKKVLAAVGQKMTESGSDSEGEKDRTIAPQMGGESNPGATGHSTNSAVATAVSIPRPQALAYLARTLAEIREFKSELHFRPERASANAYPPAAVLYGKSVPTVYGARVDGIDGIKRADAYEHLAFASGDGVCLARAAMLPEGYELVPGGRVSSDRGHVTLLGDLEGVGRCLLAVMAGRRRGIGLGLEDKNDAS